MKNGENTAKKQSVFSLKIVKREKNQMPDVREILAALTIDDRALWSERRTEMRRAYLNAHNQTVGMGNWEATDDAFMDLIDIRLALLFDRCGKLQATKQLIETEEQEKEIEKIVESKPDPKQIMNMSDASQMLTKSNDYWPGQMKQ
jgi:hypothetical protein